MEPQARNPYLWQKAKARTKFQASLVAYMLVNASLWTIWALTSRHDHYLPWPAWVSFFWGIGLVGRGIAAYGGFSYEQRTQREYERLLRQEQDHAARPLA